MIVSRPTHILRSMGKLCRFSAAVIEALCDYAATRLRSRRQLTAGERAQWLQRTCIRALHAIDVGINATGTPPTLGMVIANHLSYLDILALSSKEAMVFVAKSDVRGWPLFGTLATMAGTVYIDRNNRADTPRASAEISEILAQGVPVVVFPEGTSSGGDTVLHFHRSLFETAIVAGAPITPAALSYEAEGGCAATDVCYWGDMTLVPHLLRLFSLPKVTTRLAFGEPRFYDDRRVAAETTREQIIAMRERHTFPDVGARVSEKREQAIASPAL